jgi:hypothetical protein
MLTLTKLLTVIGRMNNNGECIASKKIIAESIADEFIENLQLS